MSDPRDEIVAISRGKSRPAQRVVVEGMYVVREQFMRRAREIAATRSLSENEADFLLQTCDLIWEEIERKMT